MRRIRSLIAGTLALVVLLSVPALAAPARSGTGWMPPGLAKKNDPYAWLFLDAGQAPWAFPYFAQLAVKGIFKGDGAGNVRPNERVTVIEAIALCVRLIGREQEALLRASASLPYADARHVPEWARGYVAVAIEAGIIVPHNRNLNPNRSADRLAVTVMVIRAIGREAQAQASMGQTLPFRDAASVPAWAVGYLAVALDLGILTGYADRTVQVHRAVTRAEMAALLSRASAYVDLTHPAEVTGEVVSVKTSAPRSITLRVEATTATYPLASYCAVYEGTRERSPGDLRPGDRVRIYLNAVGEVVFISVQARQLKVEGTLAELRTPEGGRTGQITLVDDQGTRHTWTLAANARATADGQTVPFSRLTAGSWVAVHLEGSLAVRVDLITARSLRGTVVATTLNAYGHPATIKIQPTEGGTASYTVSASVQVTCRNQPCSFTDLAAGDQVELSFQGGTVTSIVILLKVNTVSGVLLATGVNAYGHPSSITIRVGSGSTTYAVAPDVVVTSPAGEPLRFDALNPGDQVELYLENQVVRRVRVLGQLTTVSGTVVSIGRNAFGHPESLTLRLSDGTERTWAVAADVRVTMDGRPMEFGALQPGDQATVRIQLDLVREIAVAARPEKVTGEVLERRLDAYGHPQAIVVRDGEGRRCEFPVSPTVRATLEGKPLAFAEIAVGDRVELTVEQGQVTHIVVATRAVTATGTVHSRELNAYGHPARITLRDAGGATATYPVAVTVTVTYEQRALPFAELRAGDQVELRLERGTVVAIRLLARITEVFGELLERKTNPYGHPQSVTLRVDGQAREYAVAPDLRIYRDGRPESFASLLVQDFVCLTLEGGTGVAITVLVRADAFTGTIKALSAADLTVLVRVTVPGTSLTVDRLVVVTATTVITRAGQPATFADLALEQRVTVTATPRDGRFVALGLAVD